MTGPPFADIQLKEINRAQAFAETFLQRDKMRLRNKSHAMTTVSNRSELLQVWSAVAHPGVYPPLSYISGAH